MKVSFFTLCFSVLLTSHSYAASIFLVKKNVPMTEQELIRHDYFINAGKQHGLKKGMIIKVNRMVPFQDTSIVKLNEDLELPIAELKLIHVQNGLSVARVHKVLVDETTPIVDYPNVMIGDSVDLGSKRWPSSVTQKSAKLNNKEGSAVKPKPEEDGLNMNAATSMMENQLQQKKSEDKANTKPELKGAEKDQRANANILRGEMGSELQ